MTRPKYKSKPSRTRISPVGGILAEMRKDHGVTFIKISETLGIGISTVRQSLCTLGIKFNTVTKFCRVLDPDTSYAISTCGIEYIFPADKFNGPLFVATLRKQLGLSAKQFSQRIGDATPTTTISREYNTDMSVRILSYVLLGLDPKSEIRIHTPRNGKFYNLSQEFKQCRY